MKSFFCKICLKQKKDFSGTRSEIRKHIRWDHYIKSDKVSGLAKTSTDKYVSNITERVGSVEI